MSEQMQVQISGNKLPLVVLTSGFVAIVVSVIYATVWLTKLDDRVVDNAEHISAMQSQATEFAKTMQHIQSNCSKQTVLLNELEKRINRELDDLEDRFERGQ